ncbi:MAG: hypothetical protein QM756_35385 [Polyangiaceae bacterium]
MPAPSNSIAIRRRCGQSVGLGCALLLLSGFARAQCQLELTGPEAAIWRGAASELNREMTVRGWSDRCTAVSLDAQQTGAARLTYVALDGRRAEREIGDPLELVPTVQALSVELPAAEEPAAVAEVSAPKPAAPPRDSVTQVTAKPATPHEEKPIVGADLGFRAGAETLVSPCIGGFAVLPIQNWEIGVLGRYEAHWRAMQDPNVAQPDTSAVVFGVTAGLRKALGNFTLRGGLTGLLAAVRQEDQSRGDAEARLGTYVGGSWPRNTRFGLRANLSLEVAPSNIGRSMLTEPGAYHIPWWGVATTLGLEVR